jgi:hypothetical protein
MTDSSNLLPLRLMARRLRVPAKWLRAEALAGRLPHLNADGQLLFHAATIASALLARAAGENSQKGKADHGR